MSEEDTQALEHIEEIQDDEDGSESPRGADLDDVDPANVFIKFLPTTLTDSGLYALFSQFGDIKSCRVMVDPITGNSLGYGFCRFTRSEEAQKAIEAMSGYHIGNKTLLCKLSHGPSHSLSAPSDNLYIKPLLLTTTEDDLRKLFEPFGKIKECKVMIDKNTGVSRQIGFVRFDAVEEAKKALDHMNGHILDGSDPTNPHPLVIKFAESQPQKMTRRARLLANQSAAAARRYAAQLQLQQQQQQQQYQAASPIMASSTTMLAPGPAEAGAIDMSYQLRRPRGRGGSRGGIAGGRRRRPRYVDRSSNPQDGVGSEEALEGAPESETAEDYHSQEVSQDDASSDPVAPAAQKEAAPVEEKPAAEKPVRQPSPSAPVFIPPSALAHQLATQSALGEASTDNGIADNGNAGATSTEEYPGYTATATPEGYDAETAEGYYTQTAYYYQDYYNAQNQYGMEPSQWYQSANGAVYVTPPGHVNGYYGNGYRNKGYNRGGGPAGPRPARGGRRGGRGGRGRFGIPLFTPHLPPFYGPQATSFPVGGAPNPENLEQSQPAPAQHPAYTLPQNPLHPYPFMDPTNLFVFHLPITMDEKGLRKLFERFGKLEGVRVVRDRENKRSKGYGFVKFRRMQDAIQAVMQMNGHTVENKHLKVAFKSAFSDRLPQRDRRGRKYSQRNDAHDGSAEQNGQSTEGEQHREGIDEPDSDEEAALDKIVEQEDQKDSNQREVEQPAVGPAESESPQSVEAVAAH